MPGINSAFFFPEEPVSRHAGRETTTSFRFELRFVTKPEFVSLGVFGPKLDLKTGMMILVFRQKCFAGERQHRRVDARESAGRQMISIPRAVFPNEKMY
jgi:hypothetical protein